MSLEKSHDLKSLARSFHKELATSIMGQTTLRTPMYVDGSKIPSSKLIRVETGFSNELENEILQILIS